MKTISAIRFIAPEDCIQRTCDCEGECKYYFRCVDCDGLTDEDGKTVDPRGCCKTCKGD